MVSRYGMFIISLPPPGWACEAKMMEIAQLLATMVELTSETSYELVGYHHRHCVVLYRSPIHAHLA